MITNNAIYFETNAIEDVSKDSKDPVTKSVLKGIVLVVKLLHNVRTNQVELMRYYGIKLKENKRDEEYPDTARPRDEEKKAE